MKKAILSLGIVLLLVMLLFGCTQSTDSSKTDTNKAPVVDTNNGSQVITSENTIESETNSVVNDPEEVNIGEMY